MKAFLLLFLCVSTSAYSFEVVKKIIKIDGYEHAVFTCLEKGNEIVLPDHTVSIEALSNKDKNLWVINFHQRSDYDDFDLVIKDSQNDAILIQTNISNKIYPTLTLLKMIPNYPWHHLYFRVNSISGSTLSCHCSMFSRDPVFHFVGNFKITVLSQKDKVGF